MRCVIFLCVLVTRGDTVVGWACRLRRLVVRWRETRGSTVSLPFSRILARIYPRICRPKLTQTIPLSPYDVATLVPGGHAVSTRVKNGRRRIHHTCLALPDSPIAQAKTRALWKARADAFATQSAPRISSALPLELDLIILGYSTSCSLTPQLTTDNMLADGRIRRTSLLEGAQNSDASAQWSDFALPGAVLALDVVQNHRTGERVLVGGADDGTITIWALEYVVQYRGHCDIRSRFLQHAEAVRAVDGLYDPAFPRYLSAG